MTPLTGTLETGGETLAVQCDLPWLIPHVVEGADGQLADARLGTVQVHIESEGRPFPTGGWTRLARDAWTRSGEIVLLDAATSGLDVLLRHGDDGVQLVCRW